METKEGMPVCSPQLLAICQWNSICSSAESYQREPAARVEPTEVTVAGMRAIRPVVMHAFLLLLAIRQARADDWQCTYSYSSGTGCRTTNALQLRRGLSSGTSGSPTETTATGAALRWLLKVSFMLVAFAFFSGAPCVHSLVLCCLGHQQ
jgi:hypothetical protein